MVSPPELELLELELLLLDEELELELDELLELELDELLELELLLLDEELELLLLEDELELLLDDEESSEGPVAPPQAESAATALKSAAALRWINGDGLSCIGADLRHSLVLVVG